MLYILLDALFPVLGIIKEVPHWSLDEALSEAGDLTEIVAAPSPDGTDGSDEANKEKYGRRFPLASWRMATELRPQVGDLIYLLPTAQMYLVEGGR